MTASTKTEPDLSDFLPTSEVAEKYGKSQHEVQRAIRKGEIKAQKVGYFYLVWGPGLPELWPGESS